DDVDVVGVDGRLLALGVDEAEAAAADRDVRAARRSEPLHGVVHDAAARAKSERLRELGVGHAHFLMLQVTEGLKAAPGGGCPSWAAACSRTGSARAPIDTMSQRS